jgi:hypothetical protein
MDNPNSQRRTERVHVLAAPEYSPPRVEEQPVSQTATVDESRAAKKRRQRRTKAQQRQVIGLMGVGAMLASAREQMGAPAEEGELDGDDELMNGQSANGTMPVAGGTETTAQSSLLHQDRARKRKSDATPMIKTVRIDNINGVWTISVFAETYSARGW